MGAALASTSRSGPPGVLARVALDRDGVDSAPTPRAGTERCPGRTLAPRRRGARPSRRAAEGFIAARREIGSRGSPALRSPRIFSARRGDVGPSPAAPGPGARRGDADARGDRRLDLAVDPPPPPDDDGGG